MLTRILIVAASLAIGGCSTLTEYGSVRKESVRNDQGHVIGHKELLRNARTGEVLARVALYTPLLSDSGAIVGYEEQARGGSIIRDLDGVGIGGRFSDLRSRGTNSRNKGLMIVMRPQLAPQVAVVQPKLWELMAALSVSELRRIR